MSETATSPHLSDAAPTSEVVAQCRVDCMEQTFEALRDADLADEGELIRLQERYETLQDDGSPADLLELLARIKGVEEEHMGNEVSRLASGVAAVIAPQPAIIPFAGKLVAPSSFYESYTQLHELSKQLLSPVIFAEDTDAIGTGALNPIAARVMADRILAAVNRRFAIRPFVTVVRMDYESWTFLCRKHFGV